MWVKAEAIPGAVPGSSEDPGWVIPVASGVEGSEETLFEVLEPAEGIEEFPAPGGEPNRHGVYGKVPAS